MVRNFEGAAAQPATDSRQALDVLQATGSVRLAGSPALWSRATHVMLVVLVAIISAGMLCLVLVPMLLIGPANLPFGAYLGLVSVLAMAAGGLILVLRWLRKQRRFRQSELEDIVLSRSGLTLRGVGPIPWADFGPAEPRMVPAERDSGYVSRAVMELTPTGVANVNQRLPEPLRKRLSPAIGPIWNKHHRYIYVPGAQGMRQAEVMHIINTGHSMFSTGHVR